MREPAPDNIVYLPRPPVVLRRGRPRQPLLNAQNFLWLLLALLLAYFSFQFGKNLLIWHHLIREKQHLTKVLAAEEARLAKIKADQAALVQDDHLEEQARRRLGLVKKDEIVYKIVRKNQPQP